MSRLLSRSIFIVSTFLSGRLAGGDDADRVLDLDVDHEEQASRAVEPDECVACLLLGARIDQLARGSKNASAACSKDTPCLFELLRALPLSQTKVIPFSSKRVSMWHRLSKRMYVINTSVYRSRLTTITWAESPALVVRLEREVVEKRNNDLSERVLSKK